MSRNVREMACAPESVFEVLAEGWLFPTWVVGASRMRDVDADWPAVGSRLHHSFGAWPVLINDETVSTEWDPPRRAVMVATGWPIGEARISIDVKARGEGSVVRLQEEAIAGPPRYLPDRLFDLLLHRRNAETLHRLAYLAEGRHARTRETTAEEENEEAGRPSSPDVADDHEAEEAAQAAEAAEAARG